MFIHPYISFLLVVVFCVTNFCTFSMTPYFPYIGRQGGIKMVSASTPSANEPHFSPHGTAKTNDKSTFLKNGL